MQIIEGEKLPVFNWATDIEEDALRQARNLANHPLVYHHVALMPDCHVGYGMPIGGVAATENVILPNAVGVDIGCGVQTMYTDLKLADLPEDILVKILETIRENIPVGLGNHHKLPHADEMPSVNGVSLPVIDREWDSALHQISTLGAGNHFIEFETDGIDNIHVTIHSGSRNLGKQVADYYINKVAYPYTMEQQYEIPTNWELPVLPVDSAYMKEMDYCLRFARASRNGMMQRVHDAIEKYLTFDVIETVDVHHNYASLERFDGKDVWVHRKGATSAQAGEIGIIPGSQGTPTYVVRGLGNPASFQSCSHGAGRRMGRNAAIKSLNLEDELSKMQGIKHSIRSVNNLDEAPGAYKDIKSVIANQEDLVTPYMALFPIACIKGDGRRRKTSRAPKGNA